MEYPKQVFVALVPVGDPVVGASLAELPCLDGDEVAVYEMKGIAKINTSPTLVFESKRAKAPGTGSGRRGRPKGSKNLPKVVAPAEEPVIA